MSTSLDVMTETNFNKFMNSYEDVENPIDMMNELTQHYTNFSGNIGRLYDVISEGDFIQNDFTTEYDFSIYRLMKKDILDIVNASDNLELVKKWETIMESFEYYKPTENLYFIVG